MLSTTREYVRLRSHSARLLLMLFILMIVIIGSNIQLHIHTSDKHMYICIQRYCSSNMWHVLQLRFVQFVLQIDSMSMQYTYTYKYIVYIYMHIWRVQIVVVNDESYTTSRMEWKVVVVLHLEYDYNAKALPFSCSIVPIPFLPSPLPLLLLFLPCLAGFPDLVRSSVQFRLVQCSSAAIVSTFPTLIDIEMLILKFLILIPIRFRFRWPLDAVVSFIDYIDDLKSHRILLSQAYHIYVLGFYWYCANAAVS